MNESVFVSSLALLVSLVTLGIGIRIAYGWRDWKIIPMLGGLLAVCAGPTLDLLARSGVLTDATVHSAFLYRSFAATLVALAAVIALRRLIEQERGFRSTLERSEDLARSNEELTRELENRRNAERVVLEAQTRLHAILDNTPANIFIKDLEGRYLYINQPRAFADQSVFLAGFIGKTDAELLPPVIAEQLRATDLEAAEKGDVVETEHSITGARGKRTYLTVKFPLRDSRGEIYAIAGVATDITRRAETSRVVRQLFDSSPMLMCTFDADGRFLMVNPAFTRTLGYSESELIGRSFQEFVHPEDLAGANEEAEILRSGGSGVVDYENRYRARDGSYRVLSWTSTALPAEGVFYAAAIDVTDKAAQRETIRRIYQLAPVVMCTFDRDGVIVAVNPVLPRLLGFSEEELVGSHYLALLHPDDQPAALAQQSEIHADEITIVAHEGRMLCKDGSYRILAWDVTSVPHERAFYGVARDVTDPRRLEHEMMKRREEMAHSLRLQTIGELASEMSHELNQPLGAIVNFARGLTTRMRAGTIANDEVVAVVEKIASQALRGGDLIRRILAFARRADLEPQEQCLNDLVRDTVSLLAAGRTLGAEIVLELDPEVPVIEMDRSQIQQVVFNLVRNAIDAVEGRPNPKIVIRTLALGSGEIRLTVSDNGAGVGQSESERVFDAFYTTKPGGVGLGLPISRSIVQSHEGRLWVESTPGQGTSFHVALPIGARADQSLTAERMPLASS